MQEEICYSTITQNTLQYQAVSFYTSKIQRETADFGMSAFQCSTSPGLEYRATFN